MQTRIKKIMLADNEVGKIKKESPALIGTIYSPSSCSYELLQHTNMHCIEFH
jgi:hypothetical protein